MNQRLQSSIDVDDAVKSFVVNLNRHIREKNVYEILRMYRLRDSMFKDTPWPCVEAVAQYVDNNYIFCLLYREMRYRHLFATSSPTLYQRIGSWHNYSKLFQVVLHGVWIMQLPNQWLWDMVDEFVNQFQSFCQYMASKCKTKQEIHLLRMRGEAWSVFRVVNALKALMKNFSQAKDGLQVFTTATDDSGRSNLSKVFGYFAMVGLLRVHCLLGNYQTGLDCLLPIDISQQGLYTGVIGCHITTIYHYGFANLMLERYVEAIREFNTILVYIFKTKQPQQESPQYEQILKKIEQMYALLAICLSLCPRVQLIDENVNSQLMEKYGEQMSRMQRHDEESFALYAELLSYAWPTFITPFAPRSGDPREIYDEETLARYDVELLSIAYPTFFTPLAPSDVKPLVNHNQLEAVIANMKKLKLK